AAVAERVLVGVDCAGAELVVLVAERAETSKRCPRLVVGRVVGAREDVRLAPVLLALHPGDDPVARFGAHGAFQGLDLFGHDRAPRLDHDRLLAELHRAPPARCSAITGGRETSVVPSGYRPAKARFAACQSVPE